MRGKDVNKRTECGVVAGCAKWAGAPCRASDMLAKSPARCASVNALSIAAACAFFCLLMGASTSRASRFSAK